MHHIPMQRKHLLKNVLDRPLRFLKYLYVFVTRYNIQCTFLYNKRNFTKFTSKSFSFHKGPKEILSIPLWLTVLIVLLSHDFIFPVLVLGLVLSIFSDYSFKIR